MMGTQTCKVNWLCEFVETINFVDSSTEELKFSLASVQRNVGGDRARIRQGKKNDKPRRINKRT